MDSSPSARYALIALQWLARLSALALFLLVVAIVIGEGAAHGLPNPLTQPWPVAVQLLLMPFMVAGLIVAWRWERTGALATLLALAAFEIVNLVATRHFAVGAFPLFGVPPLLYLAHALLLRRRRQQTT